jgi:demethylmenaquinone methyltransferase/2-methoxy-6-polyprenyl-1,4-benzoquinol methylase
MDFCIPMLDEAEQKRRSGRKTINANVRFQQGDCLALPLPAESYDAVTIAFGLRNLADRNRGLREMHRVLRPGGSLFVLEFSQPVRWFRPLYYCYLRQILPVLAGWITRDRGAYLYLNATIEQFPNRAELAREISTAGFSDVRAQPMTLGVVALHVARK